MTIMDGQSTAERVARSEREHAGLDRDQLAAQYGWVRAVARNLVRDPWGAEDVTQETLLAALASPPPDVPDDQRLRAWLGRVAFNLSRLGVRQGARRRAREVRVARAEAMPSVSDELETAATVSGLSRAIAELSEPDRRVVLMRYFDGLSTAEIAAHTGVSELAVRKRLWRARNKLRATLAPEHKNGQILGLIFSGTWLGERAAPRASGASAAVNSAVRWNKGLAGLAAGLALCAGATWWWSGSTREVATTSVAQAVAGESVRVALEPLAPESDPQRDAELEPGAREPVRRSWVPSAPKVPTDKRDAPAEPRSVYASGTVLDLEGRARAGLEMVAVDAPAHVLATTDVLGGFRIELASVAALPLALEARGEGWTTLLPVEFERAGEAPRLLLVAPALDLAGRVVDAEGYALADAHLELFCDETAFARVEQPVRLDSAVLRAFQADVDGRFAQPLLPRAAGLFLSIERAGFERLVRSTLALAHDELFVLAATPALAELSGTVRHRDGRPAAGASVRLARASATADGRGQFRLPLRGVAPDSSLEATDKIAAPTRVPGFGSQLGKRGQGDETVEIVLGEEHDSVTGTLIGRGSAGWLVAVYPAQGGELDAKGCEVPAGLAHSDATGAFEFALPRGLYSLHALAPDALQVAQRSGLDTRSGRWSVELPDEGALESARGHVRSSDGVLLAGATLDVGVLLDGAGGRRRLGWKQLESDPYGAFGFPSDPEISIDVSVSHDEAACAEVANSTPSSRVGRAMEFVLARPAFVQVAGADAEACAVLDADGQVLAVRGPLAARTDGARDPFDLRGGWSPVLEVPASARWLLLERAGSEPVRVPIEARPGQLLRVRP